MEGAILKCFCLKIENYFKEKLKLSSTEHTNKGNKS